MKKNKKTLAEKNGILLAVFLFQFTLLIPVMIFVNSSIVIACSGMTLVFVIFYYNYRQPLNTKIMVFVLVMLTVLLIKGAYSTTGLTIVLLFAMFAGPAAVVFLFSFDNKAFVDACCILAVINFLVVFAYPFTPGYNYMRFGYGMLPSVVFAYIKLAHVPDQDNPSTKIVRLRKLVYALIIAVGTIEMFIFGVRGAIFALGLYLVIDCFLMGRKKVGRNSLLLTLGVVILSYIGPILDALSWMVSIFGRSSYAINKFKHHITEGFAAASSGRDILYSEAYERILQRPLSGNEINTSLNEGRYVHNLFLQVAQDLGLIALAALIILLLCVLWRIWSKETDPNEKIIFAALFGISVGRLMFSSSVWMRPEFWMLVFFYFNTTFVKQTRYKPGEKNMDNIRFARIDRDPAIAVDHSIAPNSRLGQEP